MSVLFLFHACSNFVRGIYFLKHVTVYLICMVFQNNECFGMMYHANYLLAKNWTMLICVGILCSECVTSMGRTVGCFLVVVVVVVVVVVLFWKRGHTCLHGFHQGVFVLKFKLCTSLLNTCVVPSSHIAIFLLYCLCYHFHVICSEYVSIMLYAMQLSVELNLGWLPSCWTYYWEAVYAV